MGQSSQWLTAVILAEAGTSGGDTLKPDNFRFWVEWAFWLSNVWVWAWLGYLFYRMVLVAWESWNRRIDLRRLTERAIQLGKTLLALLQTDEGCEPKSLEVWRSNTLHLAKRSWSQCSTSELSEFQAIFEVTLHGHDDHAMGRQDLWLELLASGVSVEKQFAEQAIRWGLIGTVIGLLQAFVLGDGKGIPLADLGFALGTTFVGLVIAIHVLKSLAVWFGAAHYQLRITVEKIRLNWAFEVIQRASMQRPTPESDASQQIITLLTRLCESQVENRSHLLEQNRAVTTTLGQIKKSLNDGTDAAQLVVKQCPDLVKQTVRAMLVQQQAAKTASRNAAIAETLKSDTVLTATMVGRSI